MENKFNNEINNDINVNNIINNLFGKISEIIPNSPNYIKIILISFILSIIIVIILYFTLFKYFKKICNYSMLKIIYYRDNKIIEKKKMLINERIEKEKIEEIYNDNNELIRKIIKEPYIKNINIYFDILLVIIFFIINYYLYNLLYTFELLFINPKHKTLIDYLLRYYYTIKWGKSPKYVFDYPGINLI